MHQVWDHTYRSQYYISELDATYKTCVCIYEKLLKYYYIYKMCKS